MEESIIDITLESLQDKRITTIYTQRELLKALLLNTYGIALSESRSLTQMTTNFKKLVDEL